MKFQETKKQKSDASLELNFDIRTLIFRMRFYCKPVLVLISSLVFILFFLQMNPMPDPAIRFFDINGRQVKVTHRIDPKFYGRYEGVKEGYLLLNEDGSGEYLYDFMLSSDCGSGIIAFEWGFIVDENDRIVHFEREYGFSYPVLFVCSTDNCFQGCRVRHMVDYILEKEDGILEVSSSDDWIKEIK